MPPNSFVTPPPGDPPFTRWDSCYLCITNLLEGCGTFINCYSTNPDLLKAILKKIR